MMKSITSLIAFALLSACSGGGGATPGPSASAIKNAKPMGGSLVVFGDSLAVGTGAQQESSKLYNCLASTLNWSDWSPYGVNGATTANGVGYIDGLLKLNPKIVVVSLGGNDVLQNASGQSIPPEETFKNLRTIYRALTDKGIFVVHMGLAPPTAGAERLPAIKSVADAEGVLFVPDVLSGLWQDPEFMSDSIHPNDKGYRKACERLADAMKPYL